MTVINNMRVKPLEWRYHPMGLIAPMATGSAYIIDTRDAPRLRWGKWPNGHGPERETLAEMQAAAEADHITLIMAELEPAGGEHG